MFTRMDKHEVWKARVEAWRASGLGPAEFCRDKEFTSSNLRYWIKQLGRLETPVTTAKAVRLARVVRAPAREARGAQGAPGVLPASPTLPHEHFVVEVGSMRAHVPAGLDAGRLEAVLVALGRASKVGAT